MTCADQTMIRRAPSRARIFAAIARAAALLRVVARPLIGRVEDLNDHMRRDVGLSDGRRTEERMRSDLVGGQPFDQLRY